MMREWKPVFELQLLHIFYFESIIFHNGLILKIWWFANIIKTYPAKSETKTILTIFSVEYNGADNMNKWKTGIDLIITNKKIPKTFEIFRK